MSALAVGAAAETEPIIAAPPKQFVSPGSRHESTLHRTIAERRGPRTTISARRRGLLRWSHGRASFASNVKLHFRYRLVGLGAQTRRRLGVQSVNCFADGGEQVVLADPRKQAASCQASADRFIGSCHREGHATAVKSVEHLA
jgi:hypothetical protein